jgi:hypothetical protein
MKKLLLFTFDYELFLGVRSGKVEDCIISPTYKLLTLLNQHHFLGTFFVDTVFLRRLKEKAAEFPEAEKDYQSIVKQLQKLVVDGHYIFPHIHPHWLDAVYLPEKNEWSLSNLRYYQFGSLPVDLQKEMFDSSMEILYSIIHEVKENFRLDAYRAGGWCIQPFEYFKPNFEKHGIKHDFSVIPGSYHLSDAHYFDFRNAPVDQPVYQVCDDVCVKDEKGPFTEWTISVLPTNDLQQWLDFKVSGFLHRLRFTGKMRGSTVNSQIKVEGDIYNNGKTTRHVATFEGLNPYRVMRYSRMIQKSSYFQFISHPKLLGDFEFKMIGLLFNMMGKDKSFETDFRKALLS